MRYIIQKNMPGIKAGSEFEYMEQGGVYISKCKDGTHAFLKPQYVENNPEWFLPIENAEVGKWVSVNERNPIATGDYIVTFEGGRVALNRFNNCWWWEGTIAWMPLPKPYNPNP